MWRNYLNTALRNIWKNKFYSFINIFGLALGIACFLFILIFVRDELSYDRYHEHADRLYRMHFYGSLFEQEIDIPQVGDPWGPLLQSEYPAVEQFVRLRGHGDFLVRYQDNSYREEEVVFADSTLFDLFSFRLLKGDPRTALAEPYTVVISEAVASKYFGAENPIGKALTFDNRDQYRVTGVLEAIPRNSHFEFDIFLSMATLEESRSDQWLSFNFYTYLLLREGVDPADLEREFPQIARTYIGSQLEQFVGQSYDDFLAGGNLMEFSLFPLERIHLYSHTTDELSPPGDIKYIYIFSFIGVFILLLACINFMNLSTARSAGRAREVGMRKVVGAQRRQLVGQFLSESVFISLLALVIAAVLVFLLLPYFNDLSGKTFSRRQVAGPWLWGVLLLVAVLVGLLAGSYPAFFLSGFQPIKVLKGKFSSRAEGAWLRNGLVVFQFAITVGLITGTIVIYDQLQYIQQKKMGYDKEHLLLLNDAYGLGNNLDAFVEAMRQHPQVLRASVTSYLPTPSSRNSNAHFLGRNPNPEGTQVLQTWYVDHDFTETMGMKMVAGRDFSREHPGDSSAVVINQQAVEIFQLDEPLGKEISTFDGEADGELQFSPYRVIGVVEDFHFESVRQAIQPLIMYLSRSSNYIALRIKGEDIPGLIATIGDRWNEMAPAQPFDYNFLDDRFEAMYESETRIGRILTVFTVLAIVIACLGLFGLATFTAEQRTKEIGIRKVLGAPVGRLFLMMTSDFARWVLLASLIALPLAYYGMSRWLEGFEYRTAIGAGSLLLALLIVLGIALLTVSYQAFRTARINPVKTLKYE